MEKNNPIMQGYSAKDVGSQMTTNEAEKNDRDAEEMLDVLTWPGTAEEAIVAAGALSGIAENEGRHRRNQHSVRGGSARADLVSLLLLFGISAGVLLLLKLAGLF